MADKTGSIDVTTNVLSQSEVSPFAIFDSLRDDNRLPLKLLPLFLHEFTHHWCFDSQVGFSFFLLREHARGILGTEQEPASIAKELARPVLKYNLAMRILMPLIEGIALFAEFDADLGETGSISVPLDYCTGLFQTQSSQTDLSPRKWSNLIRSARFSPTGRGRKKIVLSAPLGLTRRSDYLRGYLSFRAIHRRAASRNHTFENDTDFFLTYARHVFFNDAVLANLLLDQTMRLETWIDAFLSRLTERISWLSSGQDREITSQFDQLLSSKRYDAFKDFHLLNLQSTDITRWNNEIDMRKNDPTNGF